MIKPRVFSTVNGGMLSAGDLLVKSFRPMAMMFGVAMSYLSFYLSTNAQRFIQR